MIIPTIIFISVLFFIGGMLYIDVSESKDVKNRFDVNRKKNRSAK